MKSLITVIKEQLNHFYLICRLSLYEIKSANKSHYLGIFWEILNPMIQIGIYWFLFGYMMKRPQIEGVTYLPWLLAGIVVWFFITPSITEGSKAIYSRLRMISKMSFPMSAIPSFVIMAKFYQHLMLIVIIVVILQFYGYHVSFHYIELPYFMAATILFLFSLALITSTLSTIVRDVQMIVQSVVRVLLYISPILYIRKDIPNWLMLVMKANPIYYLVEGYRSALLGRGWYMVDHSHYTLYFWVLILIMLLFGSIIHVKFRDRFVDFL